MKKLILLILGLAIFANVNAQKFGVKAGGDLATIISDPAGNYGIYTGFNGSVFFQKGLIPMLSIRPALGYFQKGYTSSLTAIDISNSINYVQFDLSLRLKAPFIPLYIIAGPYASYAISGETTSSGISVATNFGSDKINNFDYGVTAGIGYQQNLAIAKLFFEINYNYGMFDYYGYSSSFSQFNRNLAINVGLMIGL